MTPAEFELKWCAQLDRLRQLDAHVRGASLCEEILADFRAVQAAAVEELLSLRQAAQESGYSADHLSRLVREGKLPDRRLAGSRGRILLRRADLPRKPAQHHVPAADVHDLASRLYGGKEGRYGHL